jgi:hypothetical protein
MIEKSHPTRLLGGDCPEGRRARDVAASESNTIPSIAASTR